MIKRYYTKDYSCSADCSLPRQGDATGFILYEPSHSHQSALSENSSDTIERGANTDKTCLAIGGLGKHVIAICRDIVCGRGKRRNNKQHEREPEDADWGLFGRNERTIRVRKRYNQ